MTAKVPSNENGTARLGIRVAETLRKKNEDHGNDQDDRNDQSELHIRDRFADVVDASKALPISMPAGMDSLIVGSSAFTASATATVFDPGCFCTARTMLGRR